MTSPEIHEMTLNEVPMTDSQIAVDRPVAAVMNMRDYAAGAAPSSDWFAGRMAPAFADDAVQVSAFALRGQGEVASLPTDEFVLVLSGDLRIESADTTLTLGPDDSAAIPFGTSFKWRASDDMLAIVYAAPTDRVGTSTKPLLIDKNAPLNPSNPPAAENLLGEMPSCRSFNDYKSASAEFSCGTWDSTPYHRRQIPYTQVELMHLLEGSVTYYDDKGEVTFTPGDVLMFVRGDGCAWNSTEYVKKVYAFHRAAA